ncbi:hypothetical protein LOTGIDRAFT_163754 [Lottia gigantea]|uniref:CCHC-type domain-containing protein n=1 Tax=Lottia gigantea TaxID=225164 RepID=V4BPT7_LOTGI|nr:hypothetical protein LOTGIDRAFT_163754 [Lottia gigantea]ESO90869.1 hypothetical protein LOTGIDRAFT_163754 [Lottia gigantea]
MNLNNIPVPKLLSLEGNKAESWRKWLQSYKFYMKSVEQDQKGEAIQCATFLTIAGQRAIEVFNTFTFTDAETDKIEPLITKFKDHCAQAKNLTVERSIFFARKQQPGETIDTVNKHSDVRRKWRDNSTKFDNSKQRNLIKFNIVKVKPHPRLEIIEIWDRNLRIEDLCAIDVVIVMILKVIVQLKETCYKCNGVDHFARCCRSKSSKVRKI